MAFFFIYSFSIQWFIIQIIRDSELTIFSLLMIKSGKNKPSEIKNKNLYIMCGLLNIIGIITTFAIPRFYFNPFTLQEYQIYKILLSITWSIYPLIVVFSLGIFFLIIGITNKEKYDIFMIWGAIFMIIAGICNFLYNLVFLHFLLDYYVLYPASPVSNSPMWTVYQTLSQISVTTYILGVIFLFIHSKENKDKMFFYAILILIIFHATYWPLNTLINLLFQG
ncbi:MAG: hypothetical protein ACTSR8_16875 [Promethearchaeota archaeon]